MIDVLIPVFNGAATLESALDSIARQTIKDIRIVVVDDGSTDATPDILMRLAARDRRIVVIARRNGGIVDALNEGLEQCTAEFLARHDADDLAYPDRLARQLDYLNAHPDCVAVGCAARHIDEQGAPTGYFARVGSPDLADPRRIPAREPYLLHPFLMTYTAKVKALGGFRHAWHAEDSDLYWRLREIGRLHNLADVLGDYRMHGQSITSASALNGRISALNSQLAALAALRRANGKPDLAFPRAAIDLYTGARLADAICQIGGHGLDREEAAHLRLAMAAKLLELASYKPYELDCEDCRFIREALGAGMKSATPANRQELRRSWSGTAARLAHGRNFAAARALIPWTLIPAVMVRLTYRMLRTGAGQRIFRTLARRRDFYK